MKFYWVEFGFAFGMAVLIFWANPKRRANQAAGFFALLTAIWLSEVYVTMRTGSVLMMRINGITCTFIPWCLALLRTSIIHRSISIGELLKRAAPLFLVCCATAALCLSDSFVARGADGAKRGHLYIVHGIALAIMVVVVIRGAIRAQRAAQGAQKIELQYLVTNFGFGTLCTVLLMVLGNVFGNALLKVAALFLVLVAFAFTGWAIAFQRIYSLRDLAARLGQLMFTTGSLVALIVAAIDLVAAGDYQWAVLLLAGGGSGVFWVDRASRGWLDGDQRRRTSCLREAVLNITRTGENCTELASRFEGILCSEFGVSRARLFHLRPRRVADCPAEKMPLAARNHLCERGWATPEALERSRESRGTVELFGFMQAEAIAALVASPKGASQPSLLLALGRKDDLFPFTYPEIERLENVAELIDNLLTHAQLAEQAALRARMEHLGMLSRGLAHDLKNLITPVSSFLVHTDGRFAPGSAEGEVHAAARRSVRVMTDYVREAMFFAERLEPRFETILLEAVVAGVRDATAARAAQRGVFLVTQLSPVEPTVADRVQLQRLLANLVVNAIDASTAGQRVTLRAEMMLPGRLRLCVADEGCGIAPEHLRHIFEPYFTTKEFGEDVRGFGLGLTICKKIADLHHGTISVESRLGVGSTFTLELPTQQPAAPPGARVDARLA